MTQYRQDARLSPNGRWLVSVVHEDKPLGRFSHDSPANTPFRVVAEDVPVFKFYRQWLVVRRLDDEVPARTHQLTEDSDEFLDIPVVLDDGTVRCADRGYQRLFKWEPDGSKRARPLHDSWQHGALYLRPDGCALLLQLPETDEGEAECEGMNACLIDLDDHVEHLPKISCNAVQGWTRDLEAAIVADGPQLVRANLITGTREVIANEHGPNAASAAWVVWNGSGFWRLATGPDNRPTAMPALAGWFPVSVIDDDRFLCRNQRRYAIVDVSRDLSPIVEIGSLPAGPIAYSRAIDAFVTWRDEPGDDADVQMWSRDGVRLKTFSHRAEE